MRRLVKPFACAGMRGTVVPAALRGDRDGRNRHEQLARELLSGVKDQEDRAVCLADIESIPR